MNISTIDRSATSPVLGSVAEPSFHEALVSCLPALRLRALALTRNRADADDLVQAAVGNALAGQKSFQPGTNFKAWMTRILRNRFFSNIRARRETVELDNVPTWRLGRSGGQEECLELGELKRALSRLPSETRMLLLMISVEGMSYEAASAQLKQPVGTLKCRVFRARQQLREWMMGEEVTPAVIRAQPRRRISATPRAALSPAH